MIKDFTTYINEGLFDRNQSEFAIRKTDKGIEQIYIPKTKKELYEYIELAIENAKKERTYPNVNLNNIDVSELGNDELNGLFGNIDMYHNNIYAQINPDISTWNIEYIPSKFFYGNKQIKEFTIPNSVTYIGSEAFRGCSSLTSIEIPNSVTHIGNSAFFGCDKLTSVTIPDSVTSIGLYAFGDCEGLTSVTIPNRVTSIGKGAFWKCGGLKSVNIPDSVTSIGDSAFWLCYSLKSVSIPDSVTNIGAETFLACDCLTSVNISKYCRIEKNSFSKKCKIIRRDD